VLESLTITIHEGEHIAILGPNGAGKSSFINAVNREYYPQLHDDVVFRIRGEDIWDVFAIAILFWNRIQRSAIRLHAGGLRKGSDPVRVLFKHRALQPHSDSGNGRES
jgi:energy-coupling factor transporter ATP-binding protein EcfA2